MLREGGIRINFLRTRKSVYDYLLKITRKYCFDNNANVNLVYDNDMYGYFEKFSGILHSTDILWSKPSELSFYCGLGIPFIISPPIGAHEKSNMRWLMKIGAGIPQPDPRYLGEWLSDYLAEGTLAQYAWNAFLNAKKTGTYNITDLVLSESESLIGASSLIGENSSEVRI